MTVGEMLGWTSRLHSILSGPVDARDERLAAMMSDMEAAYGIPLLEGERLTRFESEQPFVMRLYWTVSGGKPFEEVGVCLGKLRFVLLTFLAG